MNSGSSEVTVRDLVLTATDLLDATDADFERWDRLARRWRRQQARKRAADDRSADYTSILPVSPGGGTP